MILWMFLKSLGDLCLYFSIIGAFPGLFSHSFSYLWPVMACGFGILVSTALSLVGKGSLRFLGLVFCLAPFLLVKDLMDVLVLVLPVSYCVMVVWRGQLSLDYAQYRSFFLRSILLWAVFFGIVSLFCAFESVLLLKETTLDYRVPFQYGLLYCISAVLLMRTLRLGADEQGSRMNRLTNGAFLGGTGVILVGAVVLEKYLQSQDTSVYQELFLKVSAAIMVPVYWLINRIVEMFPEYDKKFDELWDPTETGTGAGQAAPPTELPPAPVEPVEVPFPWWLVALILAVAAVILLVMTKVYARRKVILKSDETSELLRPQKKTRKDSRKSNRSKVRQLYREFLRHQRSRGVKLRKDQTSLDILERISQDTDPEAARQLREIYLQARYDTAGEVSRRQLEEGKKTLKKSIM